MPLGTFIAGPYAGTYNAGALGLTQDGFEVRLRAEHELIADSDVYGQSVIDMVYRGGNCLVSMLGIEFGKMGNKSAIWPYGAINNTTLGSVPAFGFMGTVGRLAVGSSMIKAFVLTAISGTTAAASPATMTANQAIQADGAEAQYMMTSRNRVVPLTLRLLPYTTTDPAGMPTGTYEVWFLNA